MKIGLLILVSSSWWLNKCNVVIAGSAECCKDCLKKSTASPLIDPSVNPDCSSVNCCCCDRCNVQSLEPQNFQGVQFVNNIGIVKAGSWLSIQGAQIKNIRYNYVQDGQSRARPVTFDDSIASANGTTFYICPQSSGFIYFRAFSDDGCDGTREFKLKIDKGTESACDSLPNFNNPLKNPAAECHPTRGYFDYDKQKCECTSDWAGPPSCKDLPLWKWVASFGGGLAALASIAVSVHAFLQRKKRKEHSLGVSPKADDSVEIYRAIPDSEEQVPYVANDANSSKTKNRSANSSVLHECTL